jgi:hypothetical protein
MKKRNICLIQIIVNYDVKVLADRFIDLGLVRHDIYFLDWWMNNED